MKLVAQWRQIMRKAWSMRLMLLAGLLTGCETVLPLFVDSIPRGVFAGLTLVVIPMAMFARIAVQKDMDDE